MDISVVVLNKEGTVLNSIHLSDLDQTDVDKAISTLSHVFKRKNASYNFAAIAIGESVKYTTNEPRKIMAAAYMHAKRHRKAFKCTTLTNNLLRVTRIK
jgi:hypothetical protein